MNTALRNRCCVLNKHAGPPIDTAAETLLINGAERNAD
jgi:hypothetical protein